MSEKKEVESSDVEELRGVLRTVREEIPGLLKDMLPLIKELMAFTVTEEQAKDKAKAIATFYKELIASGIDKEQAQRITEEQFASPMELAKVVLGERRHQREKEEEETETSD